MTQILLWWRAVRPFAFTVSLIPPILGGLIALLENPGLGFNVPHFVLTGIGCMIAHAGANLLSDYYDFKARVDREGTFGSSGLLVEKVMEPSEFFRGAWVAFAIAGLIGIYLILATPGGLFLLVLVLLGGIFGIFYTAGPIVFKYRALGDLAVFVSFGPGMVLGAYYVQAHHFSWAPVIYALPVGLLVDAILHSNNLRDIEDDKMVHVRTVPILIGEQWAQRMYYGLIFGAYLLTLCLIVFAGLTLFSLLTLLSLPLAIRLGKRVSRKREMPADKFATIDAATAQLHLAFGMLLILGFILHFLILR